MELWTRSFRCGVDFHAFTTFPLIHFTVRSKHNFRFYAIKVLSKEKIVRMKQIMHTRYEQAMLSSVQHPFIINLWGSFQDNTNLYMVMDFVSGGELFTLLRRSNVSFGSSFIRMICVAPRHILARLAYIPVYLRLRSVPAPCQTCLRGG